MVHDHDVRGLRLAARFEHEAAVEEFAFVAEAVVDGRRDDAAQRVILREILELGEIAAAARSAPSGDRGELRDARRVARAVVQRRLEPVPAQIVVAAFEQRDARGPADDGAEQRQVAGEQLVLQRARAGRDDRAAARQQHGQQIRECLADPRAGLDGGVTTRVERSGDERGHLLLCGAIAEARQAARASAPSGPKMCASSSMSVARTIARTAAPHAREIGVERAYRGGRRRGSLREARTRSFDRRRRTRRAV